MCVKVDLMAPPMSQQEINSKRRWLMVGYASYAVLIGAYAACGLSSGNPVALIPAGLAAVMVAVSAMRNLRALSPTPEEGLVREVIQSTCLDPNTAWYLKAITQSGRPMIGAEAKALKKRASQTRPVAVAA